MIARNEGDLLCDYTLDFFETTRYYNKCHVVTVLCFGTMILMTTALVLDEIKGSPQRVSPAGWGSIKVKMLGFLIPSPTKDRIPHK
jgi:hypothetical protein